DWGFALGASFWSTGVFLDAADLVAGYAFGAMGVHRLEARAVTTNGRGNGALQKLGARPEAALACSFNRGGRYDPQFLWGLSAEDWRQRQMFRTRYAAMQTNAHVESAIRDTQHRLRATSSSYHAEGRPPL